jgi:hypothetical protein
MSNEVQCHWCSNYGARTFSYELNKKKFISTTQFCSRKCLTEYDDRYGVDYAEEKTGCFVATAVYEDYDHPVVLDLRFFRDNYLGKRKWGRTFISWYYSHSPFWANIIKGSRILRLMALVTIVKPLHFSVKLIRKN